MTLDNKISFIGGYIFTLATSISIVGLMSAALVGFVGGFFGLLGKEIYYMCKRKFTSAQFKVDVIRFYDKSVSKWMNIKNKFKEKYEIK